MKKVSFRDEEGGSDLQGFGDGEDGKEENQGEGEHF